MLKKISIALLICILPAMILAAEGGIGKDDRAYLDIKALVDSGASSMALTKESLTRKEAVAYIENAVSITAQADFEASKEDLQRLYTLVKSFQTDMMEAGRKLSDLQDTLVAIKVKETTLDMKAIEDKQNGIMETMGFKVNGDAGFYMTDLMLYGNKFPYSERYRPITQYIDLIFSASPDRTIYAEAVFRFETLAGGSWGQDNIYGVKNFFIRGDYSYPLKFTLGSIKAKLSPYTIWAVEDERPFESNIFSEKREMNKKELSLGSNEWPLIGGTASMSVKITDKLSVDAQVMAARVAEASGTYATPLSTYVSSINYATYTAENFVYPHDRYMAAGRLSSDFSLTDMLKAGVNFVEIKDAGDTGVKHGAPALDNYVYSADAELKLFGILKFRGEFAVSDYFVGNTEAAQSWNNKYISDTALKASVEAEYFDTKLEGIFSVVGNSFTAYAAQSRVYDGYNNFNYLSQNNTWNVSTVPAGYMLYNKVYPFTKYSQVIMANYLPIGRNLMPYVMYDNNSAPYGDSTPNRQGFTARLSGKYLDGMISPYARYTYLTEIVSYLPGAQFTCPREFDVMEAGAKIKVAGIDITGGFKHEITDNTYTGGGAHLESSVIDAGAQYTFFKKLTLNLGFKNNAFKGSEYPYTYSAGVWGYSSKASYDMNIMAYGASAEYELFKNASLALSYTETKAENKLDKNTNFTAQEIDARVNMMF